MGNCCRKYPRFKLTYNDQVFITFNDSTKTMYTETENFLVRNQNQHEITHPFLQKLSRFSLKKWKGINFHKDDVIILKVLFTNTFSNSIGFINIEIID